MRGTVRVMSPMKFAICSREIFARTRDGYLPVHFHRGHIDFQFQIDRQWVSTPNIHYHMGIDGISLWLVVLTTFLTPLCVLISWKSIHARVKEFFILLLILETALIGVFTSLDLFLFYFFWEATLQISTTTWELTASLCGWWC